MSEETTAAGNVEAVSEMHGLFVRGDEGLRRLLDPETGWVQMEGFPGGGRYVGADAIIGDAFAGLREQWESWRAVVERYVDAGESVRAEFAHLIELKGGRIVRFVQYTDTCKVAEDMGFIQQVQVMGMLIRVKERN